MADKKAKRQTGRQAESRTGGLADRRSWLERGDLVRGPGFSGTGEILGIAFVNWEKGHHNHVYHVKDARGVRHSIYESEMKRISRSADPQVRRSAERQDRDPGNKRFLSLREASNRWNTYLYTVYGKAESRSAHAPRSDSDYYSLSDDDKQALRKILESTRWRPSSSSTAAGRSRLYAFSIALRKERERGVKSGPSRDPGRAHHHRTPGAPSFAKQKLISKKIRLLIHEGYGPKQAAAIAYRTYGVARPRAKGRDS